MSESAISQLQSDPVAEAKQFDATLRQQTPHIRVTPLLFLANVAVFVAMACDAGSHESEFDQLLAWGANLGPATLAGEAWRVFTSNWVHLSLAHLAANMWALLSVGVLAERLLGNLPFLAVYLLSGIAGSLASLYWNPDVLSAGASGAIFGVYGALVAVLARHAASVPRSVLQELTKSTAVFIGYNLNYGFSHEGIDNAAHVGGLLAGSVAAWFVSVPLGELGSVRRWKRAFATVAAGAAASVLIWIAIPKDIVAANILCDRTADVEGLTRASASEIIGQVRNRQATSADAATAIDHRCVEPWEAILRELELFDTGRHPADARRIGIVQRFASLRLQAYQCFAEAARSESADQGARGAQLMKHGDEALEQLAKPEGEIADANAGSTDVAGS